MVYYIQSLYIHFYFSLLLFSMPFECRGIYQVKKQSIALTCQSLILAKYDCAYSIFLLFLFHYRPMKRHKSESHRFRAYPQVNKGFAWLSNMSRIFHWVHIHRSAAVQPCFSAILVKAEH